MVQIITRAAWGAQDWETTPYAVAMSERRYFVIHHDGGSPVTRTGTAIPQAIDAEHRAKGWSGIGYNFVASQAGDVYEGRGWGLVGAHCPGRNRDGIGVQIAIGGSQQPSAAAEHAVRALYLEACARAGRALAITWHGANYPTDCPGPLLIAWAKAGIPDPSKPTPGGDMPTPDELWRMPLQYGDEKTTPLDELRDVTIGVRHQGDAIAELEQRLDGQDSALAAIQQQLTDLRGLLGPGK